MDWWNHILLLHDMKKYICFPHFNCKTHFLHVRFMYFIIVLFLLYTSFIEDLSRTRTIYMLGICTCSSPVLLRVLCVICVYFLKVHAKYTEYTHIEIEFLSPICVYFYVLYVYSIKYIFQIWIWSILCYFGPRQRHLNDIPWVCKKYY